jgi:hypothetical protein
LDIALSIGPDDWRYRNDEPKNGVSEEKRYGGEGKSFRIIFLFWVVIHCRFRCSRVTNYMDSAKLVIGPNIDLLDNLFYSPTHKNHLSCSSYTASLGFLIDNKREKDAFICGVYRLFDRKEAKKASPSYPSLKTFLAVGQRTTPTYTQHCDWIPTTRDTSHSKEPSLAYTALT